MGTLVSGLQEILEYRESCRAALIEKGAVVTVDTPFSGYANAIQGISDSTGSPGLTLKDIVISVQIFDYVKNVDANLSDGIEYSSTKLNDSSPTIKIV